MIWLFLALLALALVFAGIGLFTMNGSGSADERVGGAGYLLIAAGFGVSAAVVGLAALVVAAVH